jgi:hypothetical protein
MMKSVEQGCQMVYFQTKTLILEGFGMENDGILYGHLAFLRNLHTLCPFGWYFNCCLVYFPSFGMPHEKQSGNPALEEDAQLEHFFPRFFKENRRS